MTPLDCVRALLFKLMSKGVVHQKARAPTTESAPPPEELCAAGLGTSSGNAPLLWASPALFSTQ